MFAMFSAHALREWVWPRAFLNDLLKIAKRGLLLVLYGSTMHVATL